MQNHFRWFLLMPLPDARSIIEFILFVKAVQNRAGIPVSVLEEIAYNHGWIDKEHLLNSAKAYGKAPYGQYLQKVADGKIIKEYWGDVNEVYEN